MSCLSALRRVEWRESRLTPITDPRPRRIARDGFDVAPAPLALHAVGPADDDTGFAFLGFALADFDVGDDEQRWQALLMVPEKSRVCRRRGQDDLRLERFSNALVCSKPF